MQKKNQKDLETQKLISTLKFTDQRNEEDLLKLTITTYFKNLFIKKFCIAKSVPIVLITIE